MKYLLVALVLLPFTVFSQNTWDGQWATSFRGIDMYISITDNGETVALTVPQQGLADMKATNSEIDGDRLDFFFSAMKATYYGTKEQDSIAGTWSQGGQQFPIKFVRSDVKLDFARPQEPKEPFPYKSEIVQIKKTEKSAYLEGTLTLPEGNGPFPAVVLVTGSGPQNRDSEILKHRPFLVLADYFTRNGYAVLRYDERGVGQSGGAFKGATSEDFSNDTEAVFSYLESRPEINKSKVGIIGHSEGGLIAPMVAARNKNVDFVILLAGPGIPAKEVMSYQMSNQYDKQPLSKEASSLKDTYFKDLMNILAKDDHNSVVIEKFQSLNAKFYYDLPEADRQYFGATEQALYFSMASVFLDPWMRYFIQTNPADNLKKVTVPILALNGKKDTQVLFKSNLKGIKKAVKAGGNKNLKIKKFKNLNHLFQTAKTGDGGEYMMIEETFNQEVMTYMLTWMNKL